jgi:hypothetical protein
VILVDSNVLLRAHPSAKFYPVVKNALTKLWAQNEALCIAPQNLVEFWAGADNQLGIVKGSSQRFGGTRTFLLWKKC